MSALRLLLAGLLVALGLVALAPAPSYACSCAIAGPKAYVDWADGVFTGTLADVVETPPDEDGVISSVDPTTYWFDVDRVLEGEVGARAEITSARFGASCGLEGMKVGQDYVVFVTEAGDRFEANLCGGTRPEDAAFVERVERVTGPTEPTEPDPASDIAEILAAILAFLGLDT